MQVVRNHELVGQVRVDQLEATVCRMPEEKDQSLCDLEQDNNDHGDVETEDFDMGCNEVLHETLAKKPAENDFREKTTLHMMENEQEPQEQAGVVLLPDTASRQRIKNDGHAKNVAIQFEDSSGPEKESQKENQGQPRQTDNEDHSIKFTPTKKEAAEWSSTEHNEKAAKAQVHTPHINQHRALNIKALVEGDILRHILVLDEEGCKKANQVRTVKMEQDSETEVVDGVGENQLLDEQGNITARYSKSPVNTEAISAHEIKNQANNRAQESLKVEKQLLTSTSSCAQLKISHKGNFGVLFANCKEEVHVVKNSERVTDSYREMPVLENAFLKEEMSPFGFCKEEEETDHVEQKQDREDEMITEDEIQHKGREQEEGSRMKGADIPHVHRGEKLNHNESK